MAKEKKDTVYALIDVTQALYEIDGKTPLVRTITEACAGCDKCSGCGQVLETEDWTLRRALTDALTKAVRIGTQPNNMPIMEETDGPEHFDRWVLAMQIDKHDELEFTEQQVELLRDRCAKRYFTVMAGQVAWMLKGNKWSD